MLLCLCTDGFRKVMHMDTGVVKQERDGPVEFQHPYFKHGQDDLLENIKRKVEKFFSSSFFLTCTEFMVQIPNELTMIAHSVVIGT